MDDVRSEFRGKNGMQARARAARLLATCDVCVDFIEPPTWAVLDESALTWGENEAYEGILSGLGSYWMRNRSLISAIGIGIVAGFPTFELWIYKFQRLHQKLT